MCWVYLLILWERSTTCSESYFQGRSACIILVSMKWYGEMLSMDVHSSIYGPFIWNLMTVEGWSTVETGWMCLQVCCLWLVTDYQRKESCESRVNEQQMDRYCVWRDVGVKMSKDKIVVMLTKGSMVVNRRPCMRMNRKTIIYVESVKYLGIWEPKYMWCQSECRCEWCFTRWITNVFVSMLWVCLRRDWV